MKITLCGKNPAKPDITVEGVILHDTANDVMKALLGNPDFLRNTAWETVKLFNSSTRVRFLRVSLWRGNPNLDEADCIDIIDNQCGSVQAELLLFVRGKPVAKRVLGRLDESQIERLWYRVNDHTAHKCICENCSMDIIPVFLPYLRERRGYEPFTAVLEERLRK